MVAPAVVSVFGPGGPEIQAFALCAAAALLGVWATRRWLPDLPGALPYQRLLIATTALWAFGVVADPLAMTNRRHSRRGRRSRRPKATASGPPVAAPGR